MQNLQANCDYIVIACNTLHLFLPQEKSAKLISLIDLIKNKIPTGTKPIILASYTSAAQNLHGRLLKMECEYWQPANSQSFINEILQGKKPELDWIVDLAKTRMLILGCTEYSLALEELPPSENVIDPIKLAAQTFFELSRCKPSSQGSTKLCEH
jgi:aspartate/glutamate racemase